ncbi:ABC transporter ATP-binding protein [Edwardsiella ictaluri]|nr:ABC transporter ATP-binding protein [Edwardsiella ictaluri]
MMRRIFKYFEGLLEPFLESDNDALKQRLTICYFLAKIKWLICIIGMLGLVKSIVDIVIIYSVGLIIDMMGKSTIRFSVFLSLDQLLFFVFLMCAIVRPILSFVIGLFCDQTIRAKFIPMVRWALYIRAMENELDWFKREHAGKISSAIWQSGQAIGEVLLTSLQVIWSNCVYICIAIAYLSYLDLYFGVSIIFWIFVYISISLKYARKIKSSSSLSAKASNIINGHFVDTFSNIYIVKALSANSNNNRFLSRQFSVFISKTVVFLRWITVSETLQVIISSIGIVVISILAVAAWRANAISVGEISVIFSLVFRLETLLFNLMSQITSVMRSIGVFQTAINFIQHDDRMLKNTDPVGCLDTNGGIVFKNVVFGYEIDNPIIKGINLHIRQGEKVAIVGSSGAGKSTLINLLLRLYEPDNGSIYLNGVDIRDFDKGDLRSNFSIVSQDNTLFNRTIYENITFGCAGASNNDIFQAAKKSRSLRFIVNAFDGKNKGICALVGAHGAKLSVGQRQRLSLCRAILRNSPIFIFDEATSSLDSITEESIKLSIDKDMEEKTVIIIAHRLSTIMDVDRIIVLHNGIVIEQGTHSELIEHKNIYYHLWRLQASL